MLGLKETDTVNNEDIYDTCKNIYFSVKECEENLLQGIKSAKGSTARAGVKETNGMAKTVTTQENRIKNTFF